MNSNTSKLKLGIIWLALLSWAYIIIFTFNQISYQLHIPHWKCAFMTSNGIITENVNYNEWVLCEGRVVGLNVTIPQEDAD
jgi:hypothetical protein